MENNNIPKIKSYDFYYELRSLKYVQAIWVFGSRARDDNQERSDIDLAIICPTAMEDDWRNINSIIATADTLLNIDLIRFDTLKDERLKSAILSNHIVLFERKINDYSWYENFLDLSEALEKLAEIINEPEHKSTYVREAAIQRFEFCIELFWKVLKKICILEGVPVNSPRGTLQAAYQINLISNEKLWLDMLEDRNLTSHTYKQSLAKEIYQNIKSHYKIMLEAFIVIKTKYNL
jgi:nucleotidyltransferase substrate binding protein (TIGR01987 family)